MIKLINPLEVQEHLDFFEDLKSFGIDHLSRDPKNGWNYALDHFWMTSELAAIIPYLNNPIIIDAGCGKSGFHKYLEARFGVNILGVDRPVGFCSQEPTDIVDFPVDFFEFDTFKPGTVDIIYWLSSIEHNPIEKISRLYQKSKDLLREGGHFLATIAISERTKWFKPSQQTNLSINDCKDIFHEDYIDGDLLEITKTFAQSHLFLMEKYRRRYKQLWRTTPEFVIAGIHQIKHQ